ncbi:hypothetical protein ATO46_18165 [Aeromonas schubertii]|nr:hypothetical protein ATO46_18165 [Aeromonas schubertii]TNI68468.1 hypothetical protein CF133_22220 [Aeromonas salmonicida]
MPQGGHPTKARAAVRDIRIRSKQHILWITLWLKMTSDLSPSSPLTADLKKTLKIQCHDRAMEGIFEITVIRINVEKIS